MARAMALEAQSELSAVVEAAAMEEVQAPAVVAAPTSWLHKEASPQQPLPHQHRH